MFEQKVGVRGRDSIFRVEFGLPFFFWWKIWYSISVSVICSSHNYQANERRLGTPFSSLSLNGEFGN